MRESDDVIAGRYRLLERIGSGGMGVVWRAHDERLGRDVAVKRLHSRPGVDEAEAEVASHRAMREARITARLHHPHAVPVFDVVEHEGQPCLVMQYFPSDSLADLVAEGRSGSAQEVARVGAEVASALSAAHEVGIVHRDVKPANVLVAADGTAKISDFGIAHAMGDVSLTSTGLVTGTPAYLAPEVARGHESTPASDVFSLGSTLYTALEGRPPFGPQDNSMALLHRVASGEIDQPRRCGALTPLLLRMLAAQPADRPTMDEVARNLRRLAAAGPDAADAAAAAAGGAVVATRPRAASAPGEAPTPSPLPEGRETAVTIPGAAPGGDDLLAPFREPPTEPGAPSEDGTGRRRRRALLAVVALATLALVFGAVARQDADPTVTAPERAATASNRGPSPTAPGTRAASSSPPAPSATEVPPTPTPTPTPTTSAAPPPAAGEPTAAELRAAVKDYYALLPGDLDAGWDHLTERYRRTTARNREYYASFWGAIDRVRVSDLTASAPDSVTATLTYDYEDGRVFVERTSYRLVEDGGILKIDSSTVISSAQR